MTGDPGGRPAGAAERAIVVDDWALQAIPGLERDLARGGVDVVFVGVFNAGNAPQDAARQARRDSLVSLVGSFALGIARVSTLPQQLSSLLHDRFQLW